MSNYTDYFSLDKESFVAIVTLNRPEKRNVIAQPFYEAMFELQKDLLQDKTIRAVAIIANGKHFSAGTDLDFIAKVGQQTEPGRALYNLSVFQKTFQFWRTFNLPVVAGIHGACLGSAIELAAACDFRICGDDAFFFLGEVMVGQSTDLGGTTNLTKLIGPGQTKRLMLTCERIDAREAARIGLVEKLVPAEKVKEETLATAQKMADFPPIAIQMAKKAINIATESSYAASLLAEEIQGIYCVSTKDKVEANKAMRDKSYKPNYTYE
ncbi:MAG: enoyl-CoA hydratase/isomerase family protein [Gracilibacteraceae bacterium]|jgi:enoyl-CoA hydratase|nr:enoyl-CoA hydratase/isomerase family protein [Gracilibacteraceae bacterium]